MFRLIFFCLFLLYVCSGSNRYSFLEISNSNNLMFTFIVFFYS